MKQFVRGLCTVLAACLLAGCAPAHVEYVTAIPKVDAPWDARQNPEGGQPTARPASTAQDLTNVYGSALLLGWPCVLYSIYLDTPEGDAWTEETLAQTRRNLTVAVDWITRQAEAYRAAPKLYYDQGEGDLTAFVSCPVELTEEIQNALREELLSAKEDELFSATMEQWLADAVITYSAEAQELMADAEE